LSLLISWFSKRFYLEDLVKISISFVRLIAIEDGHFLG